MCHVDSVLGPVTAIPFFNPLPATPPLIIVGETQHSSSIIGAISSATADFWKKHALSNLCLIRHNN